MFLLKKGDKAKTSVMDEFKRLWNDELIKNVDSRNFTKAYNFANRKYQIKDVCMRTYFDFVSEGSERFKEACEAFDSGDIAWTFMLIRQFATVGSLESSLKQITNKRRAFLSDKRKQSIVTRQSVRSFLHKLMQSHSKAGEEFIKEALRNADTYSKLISEGKYRSAYKIAALTDKSADYARNMKKYLYYAAKREITPENFEETKKYFEYVNRYYCFKRKTKDGEKLLVYDIDAIISFLIFMRNGGDVNRDEYIKMMHRTVKVYCTESVFSPICMFADYLYQLGESELEQIVLKLLVKYGEAIDEKYKKRYTCLELMSKSSNTFIFRHKPHTPIECVPYLPEKESFASLLKRCIETKEKDSWCLVTKSEFKSYEFSYKYFYDDRLLTALENVLDEEFGEYVLEYFIRTYFSGDDKNNAKHSMIIVTSGKNQYTDFPKIGIMLKFEPITKKYINIHYSVLYLPEEQYSEEMIAKDEEYINTIINNATDSRFSTFSRVVEELVWNTIDDLMAK